MATVGWRRETRPAPNMVQSTGHALWSVDAVVCHTVHAVAVRVEFDVRRYFFTVFLQETPIWSGLAGL